MVLQHRNLQCIVNGCVGWLCDCPQDQIRATQLRRLNREATPTISEVYHERNIGLGLAPPLSKLLLPTPDNEDSLLNEVTDAKDTNCDKSKPSSSWLSTAALQRFYSDAGHLLFQLKLN